MNMHMSIMEKYTPMSISTIVNTITFMRTAAMDMTKPLF